MKKIFVILLLSCFMLPAFSWSGYDYDNAGFIEFENGNTVRTGKDIEVYDYNTGLYKDYEVESVTRYGNSVEVEVFDWSTGEHRTFEMDD